MKSDIISKIIIMEVLEKIFLYLQTHYSEHCIFLYDFYGGNVIGVVLKPDVKQSKDFKVSIFRTSSAYILIIAFMM